MSKAKAVNSWLVDHFKLSSKWCSTNGKEREEISKVPYVYKQLATCRPFLSNSREEHLAMVKWILRYMRDTSWVCLCFDNGESI